MQSVLQRGIPPLIVLAVFCSLWTHSEGVSMDANAAWQGPTANKTNDKEDIDRLMKEEKDEVDLLVEEVNVLEDVEEEDVEEERTKWETAICKDYDFGVPEQDVPKDPVAVDMSIKGRPGTHVTGQALAAMLDQL
jgi:hypothetical protein